MLHRGWIPALCLGSCVLAWAGRAPAEDKSESVRIDAFVDTYASYNYNRPRPQDSENRFRAWDGSNGMSLAWAGIDATHTAEPVGGTVALRFGPAARTFAGADASHGLENVRQAFLSVRPTSSLQFDFGKFDAICGAEVADSQKNLNYSRGVLYWLGQPLFHTGLKATWQPFPALALRAMVVNGWNRSVDNNLGKTFGGQVAFTPSSAFSLVLTYVGGPEQDDTVRCDPGTTFDAIGRTCVASAGAPGGDFGNSGANQRWRHFGDAVVTVTPTSWLSLVLNGDYAQERVVGPGGNEQKASWWGAMAAARVGSERMGIAARAEYYRDPDGFTSGVTNDSGTGMDLTVYTGTVTVEARPWPWMLVRFEQRADRANHDVFRKETYSTSRNQMTTLLGVVFSAGKQW